MKRVFAAVDVSDSARAAAGAYIEQLKKSFEDAKVKWVRPDNLHITLRFFGECSGEMIASLIKSSEGAASESKPFRARLKGTGIFPRAAAPKVLWLGIDDDGNTLRLRQRLDEILKINGIEPEARGFRPHLTIARSKDPNAIRELARKHLSTQFGPVEFEAARVTIYESLLRPTGPEYSVIHTIEMTG